MVVSLSGVSVGGIALALLYFAGIDVSLLGLMIITLTLMAMVLAVKLLKWQLENFDINGLMRFVLNIPLII